MYHFIVPCPLGGSNQRKFKASSFEAQDPHSPCALCKVVIFVSSQVSSFYCYLRGNTLVWDAERFLTLPDKWAGLVGEEHMASASVVCSTCFYPPRRAIY